MSAALAMTLVVVLVPVPQHAALDGAAIYDPNTSCSGFYAAQGTSLSFHWSAPSAVGFAVVDSSENQVAYEAYGTNGSGSLVSTGSIYQFGAFCPQGPCVASDVSVNYSSPLLANANGDWTLVPILALVGGWAVAGILAYWLVRKPPVAPQSG